MAALVTFTTARSAWRSGFIPCDFVPSSHLSLMGRPLVARFKPHLKPQQSTGGRVLFVTANAGSGREEVSARRYDPPSDFYKVEAIVRPWRVSLVAAALVQLGIRGVTVTDVRGFGSQGGSRERHAGSEFSEDSFVAKVKLEIVLSHDQVEDVVETILEHAKTGEIGDGKIFIIPVADIIRVRTGERGLKAERMAGGRAELLSSKSN